MTNKLKPVLVFFIAFLVVSFFIKPFNFLSDPLSVYTKAHSKTAWSNFTNKKIANNVKINGKLKGEMNNLGIVAVRFNTFGEVKDGELTFRIKEKDEDKWYYENTYEMQKFPNNELFPFGFPIIPDSEGREFIIQLEGKSSKEKAVILSTLEPSISSKYQFTPAALLENRQFFKLTYKKVMFGTDWMRLGQTFLASLLLTFLFLNLNRLEFAKAFKFDRRYEIPMIITLSLLTAFYLVGNNFGAKFGIIDDHWIMFFLGPDQKVHLSEIPSLILSTEVGQFGHYERFRPTYYTLQVIETFIWGNNPHLWYFARYLMFSASVAIFFYLMTPVLGILLAYLFTLFVLTYPFWADIWTRLGPGEIYAVFGTALYFLGLIPLLQDLNKKRRIKNSYILLVFIGSILAMGSKENFLILLAPIFYLIIKFWKSIIKNKLAAVLFILTILFGLFVGAAVVVATLRSGHDIYQRQVAPTGRLELIKSGVLLFISRFKILYIGAFSVLMMIVASSLSGKKSTLFFFHLKKFSSLLLSFLLIFLSQYVFYNGAWPTGIRYDFPGILAEPFVLLITAVFFLNVSNFLFINMTQKNINVLLGIILSLLILTRGYDQIRDSSAINRIRTNDFNNHLNVLVKNAKEKPKRSLVFESYAISDYEAIFSLQRYLKAYGIDRPMYLRLHSYPSSNNASGLDELLRNELVTYSKKGSKNNFIFRPLNKLKDDDCISIVFFTRKNEKPTCKIKANL